MSRYAIKVNVSGSWANLCSSPADRLEAVKIACEQLAFALDHGIVFKVIDCKTDQVVALYNNRPKSGEPHGWHAPSRRTNPEFRVATVKGNPHWPHDLTQLFTTPAARGDITAAAGVEKAKTTFLLHPKTAP